MNAAIFAGSFSAPKRGSEVGRSDLFIRAHITDMTEMYAGSFIETGGSAMPCVEHAPPKRGYCI